MMKYLRVYFRFFRINTMKAFAYRGNFFLGLVLVSFESLTFLFAVTFLFQHIDSIAGWSEKDMLVLTGVFMITQALAWLLYKASVSNLDRLIQRGELDMHLVKPIDSQFLISVYDIDLEDAARGLVGFGLIFFGLQANPLTILASLPIFLITLMIGQVIIYSISLAIKTISFKSIQGWSTNAIAWRFHELARYPTDMYTGTMRMVYTYIFPLAFVATVPTKALLGSLSLSFFLLAFVVGASSFLACRLIWKWALKHYSSASG